MTVAVAHALDRTVGLCVVCTDAEVTIPLSSRLFADDCVMYRPIRHANDCEALQEDLNKLHDWEEKWQLRFNATKCNILRATHARKKIITKNYKLNGVSLAETSSTTYLGVELSADMKWNTHVKKTAAKGNQMLGVLRRNLKNCQET